MKTFPGNEAIQVFATHNRKLKKKKKTEYGSDLVVLNSTTGLY